MNDIMNSELERKNYKDRTPIPDLASGYVEKANDFLHKKVESFIPVPDLDFSTNSSIFVFVPLYRELENAQRLFESWSSQELPSGIEAEIIFFINNPIDTDQQTVENNARTAQLLRDLIKNDKKPNIRMHVVDKFSSDNELPSRLPMGVIRNIAVSPVIKHASKTGKNGIILSTDADCFPSTNVLASLANAFNKRSSVYGSLERELEYSKEFTEQEKRAIQKLFLLGNTESVLLEYLTYGEWVFPDTLGGSNTFYSINNFLDVEGYTEMPDIPEDVDFSNRLREIKPQDFTAIVDAKLINIQRYSDRVDGDGALLGVYKKHEYRTQSHPENTLAHVNLRRWLVRALVSAKNVSPSDNPLFHFAELADFLKELGINDIEEVFDLSQALTAEEAFEHTYERAIKKVNNRFFNPDDALEAFNKLIQEVLADNEEFLGLVEKYQTRVSDREVLHYALHDYVLQNEKLAI